MSWRHSVLGAALATAALLNGCASSAPSGGPAGETPPAPARTFASAEEAEAALLEAEDRKAFDLGAALLRGPVAGPVGPGARGAGRSAGSAMNGEARCSFVSSRIRRPPCGAAACFGAQALSDPSLTGDLIPKLADPDPRVVASAAKAIGFLARGDGQDALAAAIPGAASPEPRATLLRSLWRFANPASEAAALPFVSDPDPVVRFAAIYALARKPLASSGPALVAALRDSEADTAAAAARALGVLARKEHAEPLAAALDFGKTPLDDQRARRAGGDLREEPGPHPAPRPRRAGARARRRREPRRGGAGARAPAAIRRERSGSPPAPLVDRDDRVGTPPGSRAAVGRRRRCAGAPTRRSRSPRPRRSPHCAPRRRRASCTFPRPRRGPGAIG